MFTIHPFKRKPTGSRSLIEALESRTLMHAGEPNAILRINVAGPAYTDSVGHLWNADSGFVGGRASTGAYAVAGTTDDPLYYTRRFGAMNYTFDVPNASYTLKLYFAEPVFTSTGKRVFDVQAEGLTVIDNLDLVATVGSRTATSKSVDITVTDGKLNLGFLPVVENPIISAIEVLEAPQVVVDPPAAPTDLTATPNSSTHVTLNWVDNSNIESGFKIERRTGNGPFTEIFTNSTNSTSYIDTGCAPETTYGYRLRATNSVGDSAYTDIATVTTPTPAAPAVDVIVDNTNAGRVALIGSWSTSSFDPGYFGANYRHDGNTAKGAKKVVFNGSVPITGLYDVFTRWTSSSNKATNVPVTVNHAGGASVTQVNQRLNGGRWIKLGTYSIDAGTGSVEISNSGTNGFVVADAVRFLLAAPPAAPTLTASAVGSLQVNLSWIDQSPNEDGFIIQRRTGAADVFQTVAQLAPDTTYFIDEAAAPQTGYTYQVIAFNGRGESSSNVSSATTGAISNAFSFAPIPEPFVQRYHESTGLSVGGKIYVFGGYYNSRAQAAKSVETFDPFTRQWTRLADVPMSQGFSHASAVHKDGFIYLLGFSVGSSNLNGSTLTWKYNIATNTWTPFVPLPDARSAGGAGLVDNKIYWFGGIKNGKDQAVSWSIDLSEPTPTWQEIAPLPNARNHLGSAVVNGKIYAFGGHHDLAENTTNQAAVHMYDPATNIWTEKTAMPSPRGHIAGSSFVQNGKILFVGGYMDAGGRADGIFEYDPVLDRWTQAGVYQGGRAAGIVKSVGSQIISLGGSPNGSSGMTVR